MLKITFALIMMILAGKLAAQQSVSVAVRNQAREPLPGATIQQLQNGNSFLTDSSGVATFVITATGKQRFTVSYVGMDASTFTLTFPLLSDTTIMIILAEAEEHEEEVVIMATRTSRSISNTPTRVEVISGEELAEKGNMKPGDIRMLLNESTGIQTQQTSATSFNSSIRIQGLEGRYTQLLRDGYPLYGGFAGSLSILQVAPLDLRQVEVIKGSASTLYGGGAIAGLVNLVSRTPGSEPALNFLVNGTTAGGLDLSGFYSELYGKAGLTMYASRNSNKAFDPAGIGLTAIPKFSRYTINPRLFLYGRKTVADIGVNYITEDRVGGSVKYIRDGEAGFFEKNNTNRFTAQAGISHSVSENSTLQLKNSFTNFNRQLQIPHSEFDALQQSSFSELTYAIEASQLNWIIGANVLTDRLKERSVSTLQKRDYHYVTYGLFIQNLWSPTGKLSIETGIRGDYVNKFGFELLPRIAVLYQINSALSTRIGGGFGYKSPSIFTEEAERLQFRAVLPIDVDRTKNERSMGGNWDINFRTEIGNTSLTLNHLFFYTRLRNVLEFVAAGGFYRQYVNSPGYVETKGMETNARLLFGDFKLFIGYTYTDAVSTVKGDRSWLPLTARHRLNNVLMYEVEEKWKLGLEAYYFSPQKLNNGSNGKSYWITGFMAERLWEKFSVFINFENFTDTRQSKFDAIYTGSIENPVFNDIYAPVEGFVVNGGFKLNLR